MVPTRPNGTDTRKISRQLTGASRPPTISPMNEPAMAGDAVDAEGEAALLLREGVGDDRAGVREQEGAADALQDPHDDQPPGAGGSRAAR